jgi:hypothetical protein
MTKDDDKNVKLPENRIQSKIAWEMFGYKCPDTKRMLGPTHT